MSNIPSESWPALHAARRHLTRRIPVWWGDVRVGSVAQQHLGALETFAPWLHIDEGGCRLLQSQEALAQAEATLHRLHESLRDQGLIRAWRDERFAMLHPETGEHLATLERAATRFWGLLTRGAHCNGYICHSADAPQRPTHLWVARRSLSKPTDPGKLDNLIGGGVGLGQTPLQALIREGFEEAGLRPEQMSALRTGRVLRIDCDVPEGRMVEDIHVFDLALPPTLTPVNQDGEVSEITLMPIEEALSRAARAEMTTDAALVTLDFAVRHGLLPAKDASVLQPRLLALESPTKGA